MNDDAKVVPLRPIPVEYARFVMARHEMNLAFQSWLLLAQDKGAMNSSVVDDEICATTSVLNQLRDIWRDG